MRDKAKQKGYMDAWRARNKERLVASTAEYRDRNREKLRQYARDRYRANPELGRERARQWREKNPEKVAARRAREAEEARARRPVLSIEEIAAREMQAVMNDRARSRRWRENNRERKNAANRAWAAANPEKIRAIQRAQYAKNPARSLAYTALRRARVSGVNAEKINRDVIYDRDGGKCHICKRKVSHGKFHLDHLVPISKGGEHVSANVAVAHPRCNRRRSDGRIPAQLRLVGE